MNVKNFIIKIEKNQIKNDLEKKINKISKEIELKGFRKGFVPKNIIKKRFKEQIENEIINNKINFELKSYIEKNKLNLISSPKIEKIDKNNENFVEINIKINSYKEIKLNLKNIKINEYNVDIEEKDVENEIKNLQDYYGTWKNISTFSKDGDILKFSLYKKFKESKNFIIKEEEIKLDTKDYKIKGLKDFLKKKIIDIEYELFINENKLSDKNDKKSERFYLMIKEIKRLYPIKLSEELMKKIGIKNKNINELKNIVRNKLSKILNNKLKIIKEKQIIDSLIKNHDINIDKDLNTKENIKNLKLSIILMEIKKQFNINVNRNEIKEKALLIYNNFENIKNNKEILKEIENKIYLEKIINIIEKKIEKEKKK